MLLLALLVVIIIWIATRAWRDHNAGVPGATDLESLSKKAILKIAAISGHQPDQRVLRSKEVAVILGLNWRSARKLFRAMAKDHWIRFCRPVPPTLFIGEKAFKMTVVGVEVAANFEKAERPEYKVDEGARF